MENEKQKELEVLFVLEDYEDIVIPEIKVINYITKNALWRFRNKAYKRVLKLHLYEDCPRLKASYKGIKPNSGVLRMHFVSIESRKNYLKAQNSDGNWVYCWTCEDRLDLELNIKVNEEYLTQLKEDAKLAHEGNEKDIVIHNFRIIDDPKP